MSAHTDERLGPDVMSYSYQHNNGDDKDDGDDNSNNYLYYYQLSYH